MKRETSRTNRSIKTIRFWFWVVAAIVTLFSAYFQRTTGPTYPLSGKVAVGSEVVQYNLLRSAESTRDARIAIKAPEGFTGVAFFKRHKTDDQLKAMLLAREGEHLAAYLPLQPPAGKLEYYIVLRQGPYEARFPDSPVIMRFKGFVPGWIIVLHVVFIFAAMLTAARAGVEAFRDTGQIKGLMWWTLGFLIIGGFIFGPILQKYAFGAWWTGVPFGTDLTDNKTLIALIAWLIALRTVITSKPEQQRRARWAAFFGAFVMLGVFMIPHSLLGSELDYSKLDSGASPPTTVNIQ